MTLLSRASIPALSNRVSVPRYDVAAVTPGIVHLGLGNFHRAHMARYSHNLMNSRADALHWGIIGAGLLPADRRMHDVLTQQDCLYTLVERDGVEKTVTIIGSLAESTFAGDSTADLLDTIDSEAIRIVSLTITENGYYLNRATKRLDV